MNSVPWAAISINTTPELLRLVGGGTPTPNRLCDYTDRDFEEGTAI